MRPLLNLLLVAALVLLAGACSDTETETSDALPAVSAEAEAAEPDGLARIEIEAVRSEALRARIAASGTIEARRLTPVAAEVHGRIVRVHVDVGDDVPAGAPLFQIDPGPYRMVVAEAQATLALAEAESRLADAEAERVRVLVDQSVSSKQRWDQLRTVAEVSKAQVAAAQARLDRAQRDRARTVVRAPYDASIVERRAHEGAMAGMEPILVLQEQGALEAILDVPEATPVAVRVGDPVRLFVEGLAAPIEVQVARVSGRVDPQTRTYEVRADLAEAGQLVKAGSYTRAEIEPSRQEPYPVVNSSSVLNRDGRSYLLRVTDGVVEHVPVRVGIAVDEDTEILSGIEVGDRVVAGEAVVRLSPGTAIEDHGDQDADRVAAGPGPAPEAEPGT